MMFVVPPASSFYSHEINSSAKVSAIGMDGYMDERAISSDSRDDRTKQPQKDTLMKDMSISKDRKLPGVLLKEKAKDTKDKMLRERSDKAALDKTLLDKSLLEERKDSAGKRGVDRLRGGETQLPEEDQGDSNPVSKARSPSRGIYYYTYDNTTTYNWTDTSEGTRVLLYSGSSLDSDMGRNQIPLPFNFPFF